MKKFDKSEIKKILIVLLSNIGDVIAGLPVIDILLHEFPRAEFSIIVGPKGEAILKNNPRFKNVYTFDKRGLIKNKLGLMARLRREHFDMAVDLRNTAIPLIIGARYSTPFIMRHSKMVHMRQRHLNRLHSLVPTNFNYTEKSALYISDADCAFIQQIITKEIGINQRYCVFTPSAADHRKRWTVEGFTQLADRLIDAYGVKIVIAGDPEAVPQAQAIVAGAKNPIINLTGRTNLLQLVELLKHCSLSVANDSGPMHLASYLDVPVMALFGPTDPIVSRPWSRKSSFVKKDVYCRGCQNLKLGLEHTCMEAISADDVFQKIQFSAKEGFFFKE